MPNRRTKFTQADITRALKSARNAGLTIYGYKIEGDCLVIDTHGGGQPKPPSDRPDPDEYFRNG